MRIGVYGWGHAPARARREMLWHCLRGLGDSVVRLRVEPAELGRGLAGLRGLRLRSGNRLVASDTGWAPRACGPDIEGVWLYGAGPALHLRRSPALVLAPLATPDNDIPTRSLLFFDEAGELVQSLEPDHESTARALDGLIESWIHPRQDCLPTLDARAEQQRAPATGELSALERLWCQCDDEPDFTRALQRLGLDRRALYQRIGDQYAAPVAPETLLAVPEGARARGMELVLTEVNHDSRLEYRAIPHAAGWRGAEVSFCLGPSWQSWHCDRLGSVWRVRRPGADGIETTLEVFDDRGELALILASDNELLWRRLLGDSLYRPVGG